MATSKKDNKAKKKKANAPLLTANRKKQWRQGFGLLLLVTGVFICFSIISYCFTWQEDQDKLISSNTIGAFLKNGEGLHISNWGGRLGAAVSHLFVYEWVGIAAMSIGLWLGVLGIYILNPSKPVPFARYIRWTAMTILVLSPVLTYLIPDASFPYGGAWGNEAIHYMNGLFGVFGTGLVLFAIVCFFLFVVLALDIRPLLRRAKSAAGKVAEATAAVAQKLPTNNNTEDTEEETETPSTKTNGNTPKSENIAPINIPDEEPSEDTGIALVDKEEETETLSVNDKYAAAAKEEPVAPQSQVDFDLEEEPAEEKAPKPTPPAKEEDDKELSFEVNKTEDEVSIPEHGGHISLADNEKYAPELDLPHYKFPTLDLLEARGQESIVLDKDELEQNKNQIVQTLKSFGIEIQRISATVGPTVTLYEIVPAEGVRISKIRNLEDDIALNLAALGIRIIAPIPGRGTIGIEVPNAHKQIVSIRALLSSEKFANSKMSLPIALGKKIDNENYIVDLATMPHLLMAGATGQGKSVGINTILVSLLYKKHPSQLKFVMVDPKKVELSIYRTIEKHFLAKLPNEEEAIITDTKKVIYTLNALCIEMDNRYELLKDGGARNIKEYNDKFIKRRLNPEHGHKYLPFIVLVIDEFADLMMTAGKEVEMPIARLAQLARAVGIHLIIATQRPSVNVITGTIKANFPARIAFKVSAKVDSRTILDAGGAEQLIGRGDMLISFGSELLRLQCAFVDTPEVDEVVDFIGEQRGYPTAFELPEYEGEEGSSDKKADLTNRDKLFEDCARTVVQSQSGSTSMLQRRFNLGYNRAGRIMDQLEAADIVGPSAGSKPRDVLVHTEADLEQLLAGL